MPHWQAGGANDVADVAQFLALGVERAGDQHHLLAVETSAPQFGLRAASACVVTTRAIASSRATGTGWLQRVGGTGFAM